MSTLQPGDYARVTETYLKGTEAEYSVTYQGRLIGVSSETCVFGEYGTNTSAAWIRSRSYVEVMVTRLEPPLPTTAGAVVRGLDVDGIWTIAERNRSGYWYRPGSTIAVAMDLLTQRQVIFIPQDGES